MSSNDRPLDYISLLGRIPATAPRNVIAVEGSPLQTGENSYLQPLLGEHIFTRRQYAKGNASIAWVLTSNTQVESDSVEAMSGAC